MLLGPWKRACRWLAGRSGAEDTGGGGTQAGADAGIATMMSGAIASWFETGDLEETDQPGFGRLGEIRAPTAVLLGDLEYPMVTQASRAIAARPHGSRTILLPGADHLLPLREPGRLAQVIAAVAGS